MPNPHSVLHSVSSSRTGGRRFRFLVCGSSCGSAVTAAVAGAAGGGVCSSAALTGSLLGFRVRSTVGRRVILSLTAFAPVCTWRRPSAFSGNEGRVQGLENLTLILDTEHGCSGCSASQRPFSHCTKILM